MTIYIHDAPFPIPLFSWINATAAWSTGRSKWYSARQDHDVGGEKNWGAASRRRWTRREIDTRSRDLGPSGCGQALQPGSNGIIIPSARNQILGGSTCIYSNSYLNIANLRRPCDSRQDGHCHGFQPPLIFST